MEFIPVTIRQAIAGLVMGVGTAGLFELSNFWLKIVFGVLLWLVYYLILNLQGGKK